MPKNAPSAKAEPNAKIDNIDADKERQPLTVDDILAKSAKIQEIAANLGQESDCFAPLFLTHYENTLAACNQATEAGEIAAAEAYLDEIFGHLTKAEAFDRVVAAQMEADILGAPQKEYILDCDDVQTAEDCLRANADLHKMLASKDGAELPKDIRARLEQQPNPLQALEDCKDCIQAGDLLQADELLNALE